MKSHELAKQLLSMPNRDLFLSIDMSEDEETADHRAFSDSIIEVIDNGTRDDTITILAESGSLNF